MLTHESHIQTPELTDKQVEEITARALLPMLI